MKSHKKRTFHIQHKALLAGLFLCLGFVPCLTACTRTPADILVESVPESAPAVSEADSGLPYETTNHTAGETTKESSGELTLEITTSASEPAPDSLESLLNSMTLEEKVGQMFIARYPETDSIQTIQDYHLGGYILFARDFEEKTKQDVINEIKSCQTAAEIPMFIGVDEEGGTVNRISKYPQFRSEPFASPQTLFASGGFESIEQDTLEKCQLLKELGINLNFAPVCDVSEHPEDFIYSRTLGQNAEQTARYAQTVVTVMSDQHMGSVLKHFPGYGNNTDTHTGISYDDRSLETFETSDFLPFSAGIKAGADMVLVSHNIVSSMDSQYPASLSPKIHDILRKQLGFSGVIITDDLYMDGVRQFADDQQVAVLAVQAGNDLLCCTDFEVQIPAVINAVKSGEISEERIDESVLRILNMKQRLGLLSLTK